MPTGFQQDPNQLTPGFFRITLDLTGYPTADGNDNGGVTPYSADSFATAELPTTLATGKQRARGNMRFRNIINRLSNISDCQILDVEIDESAGGADGDTQAAKLVFTVKYDRPAWILGTVQQMLGSPYTGYDGATPVTTTLLALKDQVARGIGDATTAAMKVYDGTTKEDRQLSITVAPPAIVANLWADVAVSLIDGTEVISTDNDVV